MPDGDQGIVPSLVVCRGFGDRSRVACPRATLSRISSAGLVQTKGSGWSFQWERSPPSTAGSGACHIRATMSLRSRTGPPSTSSTSMQEPSSGTVCNVSARSLPQHRRRAQQGGHSPPGCAPPQRVPPRRPTTTPWPGAPPEPARCANEQAAPAQPAVHPSSPKPQPQPPSHPHYNRSLFKRHIAGVPHRRYSCEMRPLRYSINVTLDGCCDHRGIPADEDLHRHAVENLNQADALLFGRVTYEMMESALRPPAPTGARPDWMEPFAQTINAAKKYVVSSTLEQVDWNAELVRGDLGKAVQQLKRESGKGLFVGGVKLPLALTELGLIDEYEFVVHPRLAGHGPTLFAGLSKHVDLKLVSRLEFGSGAVAMRYEPRG